VYAVVSRILSRVNAVAQIFAVIAGLVHVGVFVVESLLLGRPKFSALFLIREEDVPVVRPWATNQGWYNLFLAAGALGGVVLVNTWDETAGRTLALFACGCMVVAGIVLFVSERRLWRGSLGQAVPPLIAVLASLV